MNEKVLHITEFDKIIEQLVSHADSAPGKAKCRTLLPMDSLFAINRAQEETEEALSYIFRQGSVSFGSVRDFSYTFGALSIGSSLSAAELLHLSSFLENVARVRTYGLSVKERSAVPVNRRRDQDKNNWKEQAEKAAAAVREEEENNVLFDLFDCLCPLPGLVSSIHRCILSEEEIADEASSELRKIRREMGGINGRIHAALNKMVNVTYASYLQDSVVTMRGDRYCIPVKAEHKGHVPGIVHDQSSSGATLFIEPTAVVNLNNELRELLIREKKEIEKILALLSQEAADHLTELKDNAINMTELDFIFARADLALEQNGSRPVFNDRHYINIRKGRHPLIDKKKVVPIDLELGDDYDMIIITGPNTGGKTVTLKTVGLFELMGMSGLHIPAGDRSELSLFREVFADIGDEQSIEQSLSTFSAHMTTIVDILRRVDKDCLCLFDELGAGTDPTEGAALAISILNFMHVRGIRTLATTHYSELKVYALRTDGIENASCEFDVETLQPTYRLTIGVAGKSNAFAISKKLGLPGYIIETAREQLSQETKNFEDLLSDLEDNRRQAQKEHEEAAALRDSLRRQEEALKNRERQLEEKKEKILQKAHEQARDILQEAKDTADQAISDLRKSGSRGNMAELEKTRSGLRDKVSKKEKKLQKKKEQAPARGKLRPEDLHIGDKVRVISMGLTGTVTGEPRDGKVKVQCGIMNSQVRIDDLLLIHEDAFGNPTAIQSSRSSMKKAFAASEGRTARQLDFSQVQSVSPELNLLGMTTDDAVRELDKYLDDARVSHLESVRIVHGKGTGALRNAVHQYLRRQKWVKSFRLGDFGEGDAGVTIVRLK